MKAKRQRKSLQALLANAAASDFDEREYALFQLRLILEQSNSTGHVLSGYHNDNLPRFLRTLNLNDRQQMEVIDRILELIMEGRTNRTTAFWVLQKANRKIAASRLLDFLQLHEDEISETDIAQILEIPLYDLSDVQCKNDMILLLEQWQNG